MVVIMFQPRFARLVERRTKTQTIRPPRKRPIVVGAELSLREWAGKPYRSPQRELIVAQCTRVAHVHVHDFCVVVAGTRLEGPGAHDFAVADGFKGFDDMVAWFAQTHALPFTGVLIRWA